MKILISFMLFILLAGCETTLTGYRYKINAVYQAPQSKFTLTIDSEGYVEPGADTSDSYNGTVKIEPTTETGKNVILIFQDNNEVSYKIDVDETQIEKWGFRYDQNTLTQILSKAGYADLDQNEIAESITAIGGVFGGPKGVILDGQSKHIKVLKADLGENN